MTTRPVHADAFAARIQAALDDTRSAADFALGLMTRVTGEMSEAWTRPTHEADVARAQADAIRSVVARYREELSRFAAQYPSCAPFSTTSLGARAPTGSLVRQSANGWAVADTITAQLRERMHGANAAAGEAAGKVFSGRLRENAKSKAEDVQRLVEALDREARRLETIQHEAMAARDADARTRRASADERLSDASARLADAAQRLPPALSPSDAPSWTSWSPGLSHSDVLLGFLRCRTGQIEGPNRDFGTNLRAPVFVSMRGTLRLSHQTRTRDTALAAARSLVLRALASTPPGKLRLSVFDPTGLGQSVSSLLELGEYDRDLIGGKVWSSAEDLQRVLAEHTAHIELVIQKYLRAEYATLDEFNAAAGEIAEPHRLLVICDAPAGFDERSFSELRRVIENGPRSGIATLLITCDDAQVPHGVDIERLPGNLQTLRFDAPLRVSESSAIMFDLLPSKDSDFPPGVVESVIQKLGLAARESTSKAVSFERAFELYTDAALEGRKRGLPRLTAAVRAGDPSSWWSQRTLESVAAPVGLRGARDVATLIFDSSNHAGALLVGRPGSGKSTLLHTFIAGITTMYGPEELELHLIDFKEGVEFKVYAADGLPHARTVAIESDREFGVSVLQAIQAELSWRGSLLRGSTESHSSLETLRWATGERLPRIVLIFDEFQVLFARNDKLGAVAAETMETLIRQGRGFGIHVLLGSQSLSGLDALGSHVPQLLPVRILMPAAESDAFKVLGETNTEGSALTTAGEGILNAAGGAVEANERFRGAIIAEDSRRSRVVAMRAKADEAGFHRRPVVFEGNAPIPAEDTPAAQFVDEIRGADARALRLRFGTPMAISGSADINLRRESGANLLLVARDTPLDATQLDAFSLPRAVTINLLLSAVARRASVEVIDFLSPEEGLEESLAPLRAAEVISVSRRRQVPELLERIRAEVQSRVDRDDTSAPPLLLAFYGMHRARDFDQESVDYDASANLPDLLGQIMRDGPEFGVHSLLWFDSVASISRRLSSSAVREASWRLAGRMSADDSSSFIEFDGASSLREQQVMSVNEDRGVLQRCTTISVPSPPWIQDFLIEVHTKPKERAE